MKLVFFLLFLSFVFSLFFIISFKYFCPLLPNWGFSVPEIMNFQLFRKDITKFQVWVGLGFYKLRLWALIPRSVCLSVCLSVSLSVLQKLQKRYTKLQNNKTSFFCPPPPSPICVDHQESFDRMSELPWLCHDFLWIGHYFSTYATIVDVNAKILKLRN